MLSHQTPWSQPAMCVVYRNPVPHWMNMVPLCSTGSGFLPSTEAIRLSFGYLQFLLPEKRLQRWSLYVLVAASESFSIRSGKAMVKCNPPRGFRRTRKWRPLRKLFKHGLMGRELKHNIQCGAEAASWVELGLRNSSCCNQLQFDRIGCQIQQSQKGLHWTGHLSS